MAAVAHCDLGRPEAEVESQYNETLLLSESTNQPMMYMKLGSPCPLNPLTAASTAVRVSVRDSPRATTFMSRYNRSGAQRLMQRSSSAVPMIFIQAHRCSLLRSHLEIRPTTANSSSSGTLTLRVLRTRRPSSRKDIISCSALCQFRSNLADALEQSEADLDLDLQ